jgi:2-deoxy-D-gluconate 3-dehydrogenase
MDNIKKLLDLNGKTAIVTGGGIGIGYGITYRLSEAGANVVIADRSNDGDVAAKQLLSKKFKVMSIKTDVSQETDVQNLIDQTVKKYGTVDILVNNAGIYPVIPVTNMSLDDFQRVLSINLIGAFLCTKYASRQMITQGKGGRIINITSIDALHPSSMGLAHYDASKHGLWGFTKNAALELAQYNIWVNAIAPGAILTPGVQKLQQSMPNSGNIDMQKMLDEMLRKIPMHRLGDPDDIGKVALFLASDMASYITGTQIVVDGGVLLS